MAKSRWGNDRKITGTGMEPVPTKCAAIRFDRYPISVPNDVREKAFP
jgi:hypothetical protein